MGTVSISLCKSRSYLVGLGEAKPLLCEGAKAKAARFAANSFGLGDLSALLGVVVGRDGRDAGKEPCPLGRQLPGSHASRLGSVLTGGPRSPACGRWLFQKPKGNTT